jgi:predicted SnoaL-like aldol condensation-catalyzing enzyme
MKKIILVGVLATLVVLLTFAMIVNAQEDEPVTTEIEMENAQLVQTVYAQLVNERDLSLLDRYWSEDFVQHNPTLPDGRDALRGLVESLPPEAYLHIYRVIADDDLVAVHGQITFTAADRDNEFIGLALVDIFRVVDGRIVEHWDVTQNVPAESVSGNSMFDGAGQVEPQS